MQACNRHLKLQACAGIFVGRANLHFMAGNSKQTRKGSSAKRKAGARDPEWTKGLKKLYDSVVDEPLPDSFKELLSRLDAED